MRAIQTHLITPDSIEAGKPASETEKLWVYNGLDCCVTHEVFSGLRHDADNTTLSTYEFEKSLMGPVLEINTRGLRVDQATKAETIKLLQSKIDRLESQLNRILEEGLGEIGLNWRSPDQLKRLFYKVLNLPEIKKRRTNGPTVTVDREALEKLSNHFYAEPIVSHLLLMRDIAKKISTLKTEIDPDGRMRTSINIAGTETGRFSSSYTETGIGGNLQNIEEALRKIYEADPGMKFAYIDLEQAESRAVGAIEWNLFHDGRYLDACESGDLHTSVCRLAWSNLPWTGDLKKDKEVAETPFYRQHTHRHMAKVLGHGTNYAGQPYTMSKHTKLEASIIKEFQAKYFTAFPSHLKWHESVAATVLSEGRITTMLGRRRYFWGRRSDPTTIREAVAFEPQSMIADILNRGMLQVWRLGICQLLLQIHDAILIQYPEDQEDIILPKALEAIKVPVELAHGRTLVIPSEAKVGWNWAGFDKDNPNGLQKYRGPGSDNRKRHIRTATSVLDRLVSSIDRPPSFARNLS